MNGPLQEFSPDKSNYERPTLGWTCGRKSEGDPCHIGPSDGGNCQAHLECVPARGEGGYVCSRPPSFGGKCDKGPLPDGSCCQPAVLCHPKRTLFGRRRVVTITFAGLALGVLLCTFGGSAAVRNAVTSPGALTLQHTSSVQTCDTCHDRADSDFDTLSDSLKSSGSVALNDSTNCLKCHDFGPDALNPHALSADALASMTEDAKSTGASSSQPFLVSLATQLAGSPMDEGQLACSRCHKEHRGKFHDLTKMADAQCQICHTNSFHGFNAGHPEFSGFPYTRRTRIHFDHATHYGNHFSNFKRIMPNGQAPQGCETCHQPDPSHQTMPLVNFAQACGSCHGEQLQRTIDSITLVALPQIDLALLQQSQSNVGEWPAEVETTMDDGLPPFMQLLLEHDDAWADAQKMLRLAEQDGDAARSRAQVHVAWATKALIGDLVQNGETALRTRLSAALGSEADTALFNSLTVDGALLTQLRAASAVWFPNLEQELAQHATNASPELTPVNVTAPSDAQEAGWNTGLSSIRYLPSGHADRTVQSMIDALVAVSGVTASDSTEASSLLFSSLTDPAASFRCMSCHTVDASGDTAVVNWFGHKKTSRDRAFVRFSHAPHVTLLSNSNVAGKTQADSECAHCHQLQDFTARDEVFLHSSFVNLPDWTANTNPHSIATSGFDSVNRELCAGCHTESRAGESCLKCHNYHVGHFAKRTALTDHAAESSGNDEPSVPPAAESSVAP